MNGKRYQSSLLFLRCPQSQWALALMAVAIEGFKVLTHYWSSCLGQSLRPGSRPPLFRVLDPRSSVVFQCLQYFASLLMSESGDGRLLFLWGSSGYASYADFCACCPDRVREIRRTLMLASEWIYRRHHAYLHRDTFSLTLVGDKDCSLETRDAMLRAWDRKHVCCVAAGMPRDLKRAGVTSSDLMTPAWQEAMYWTAFTMQLSCADIESMHSQNRAMAGSAFHSIAARYINTEAQRFSNEALDLQQGVSKPVSDQTRAGRKVKVAANITVQDCTGNKPNLKALSPFELFRKRYIELHQTTGFVNPCSKEFWNDVKDQWNKLSQEEKDIYQTLSEQSRVASQTARAKRRIDDTQETSETVESTGEALVVQPPPLHAVHTQVVPLTDLCELVSRPEDLQKAVCQTMNPSSVLPKSRYPLGEEALEHAWRTQRLKGVSGKESIKKFRVEAERIARPSEDDVFPKKVVNHSCCGLQCRHFAERTRVELHAGLLQRFRDIVSFKGGVKQVVESDTLCGLALTVVYENNAPNQIKTHNSSIIHIIHIT